MFSFFPRWYWWSLRYIRQYWWYNTSWQNGFVKGLVIHLVQDGLEIQLFLRWCTVTLVRFGTVRPGYGGGRGASGSNISRNG